GVKLGLNIQPNACVTLEDRATELKHLEYEFKKAIEFGKYPVSKSLEKVKTTQNTSLAELLDIAIENKKKANLSRKYLNHLETLTKKLKAFLTTEELNGNINDLQRSRIQDYMNQFNSSASNYMTSRRHIKAVFGEIDKDFEFNTSIVTRADSRKATPKLHKIYSEDQLPKVLDFLKKNHTDLYLCCLISYECLLRTHNEIKLLKRHHFKNNITEIHLSGNENKGKKIRT